MNFSIIQSKLYISYATVRSMNTAPVLDPILVRCNYDVYESQLVIQGELLMHLDTFFILLTKNNIFSRKTNANQNKAGFKHFFYEISKFLKS
jgi:hypothetical protein